MRSPCVAAVWDVLKMAGSTVRIPVGETVSGHFNAARIQPKNSFLYSFLPMAVISIKKVPADAAMQKGRLILLALEYKLNSVCNAEMFRCTGACL